MNAANLISPAYTSGSFGYSFSSPKIPLAYSRKASDAPFSIPSLSRLLTASILCLKSFESAARALTASKTISRCRITRLEPRHFGGNVNDVARLHVEWRNMLAGQDWLQIQVNHTVGQALVADDGDLFSIG